MNDAFDTLALRYLDGTAGDDELRQFEEQLRSDPAARRELFLTAAQDAQLREILAGESINASPPLTFRARRVARFLAAAAAVLILVTSAGILLNRYPQPEVSGTCRVVGGGEIRRGALIATDAEPSTVTLGGYCRVEMGSGSRARLEGAKYAEQVYLDNGNVVCEADHGVGKFTVRTELGSVSVNGTKFTVRMKDTKGGMAMFDRRMIVGVLAGTVLVTGTWGDAILRAGQEAALPPPGAALGSIVAELELPDDTRAKVQRTLSLASTVELQTAYRTEVRMRLFDAARRKLQTTMPRVMPKKVQPKVQAIRRKNRAGGPPSAGKLALIRMASQKRARKVMMPLLHKTADELADACVKDDRHMAWLLAARVRTKLPGEQVAAFDKAVKDAGLSDNEPQYVAKAETAIEAAIAAYDPDITGIIDPATGKVIVTEEDVGVPVADEALSGRVAKCLRTALADLALSGEEMKKIEPLLAPPAIEAARLNYCMAVRARLFEAARKTQATVMPRKMPGTVQAKVMAIRTRVKAGGPPSAADIARIQRAVMGRSRSIMAENLHRTADAVAVQATKDALLVAAYVAASVRTKLPSDKAAAFDTAINNAGITGNESTYLAEVTQRIETAIATYDPDLSGIVSPVTGEVVVKD